MRQLAIIETINCGPLSRIGGQGGTNGRAHSPGGSHQLMDRSWRALPFGRTLSAIENAKPGKLPRGVKDIGRTTNYIVFRRIRPKRGCGRRHIRCAESLRQWFIGQNSQRWRRLRHRSRRWRLRAVRPVTSLWQSMIVDRVRIAGIAI